MVAPHRDNRNREAGLPAVSPLKNRYPYAVRIVLHLQLQPRVLLDACPDLNADKGEHEFIYSYYVWDGPFMNSRVVREGYELNVPVTQAAGASEPFSLLSVDAPNVIIDTMKLAEDGSGDMIVRLYESKHADTKVRLTFGFGAAQVHICDMLENPSERLSVGNGGVVLSMRAFEVKTVRIARK